MRLFLAKRKISDNNTKEEVLEELPPFVLLASNTRKDGDTLGMKA